MSRLNEGSDPIDKQATVREIALFLSKNPTNPVPQKLLEPFEIGETVINTGRAGGGKGVVRGSPSHKHLRWEN